VAISAQSASTTRWTSVHCPNIFTRLLLDKGGAWPPVRRPATPEMMEQYTMHGRIAHKWKYYAQKYLGEMAQYSNWTMNVINKYHEYRRLGAEAMAKANIIPYGAVSVEVVEQATAWFPVAGKRGAVIGSERPWLESLLLLQNASSITTMEYGVIHSEHPRLHSLIPRDQARSALNGTLEQFDFVFTYSSIEHSGLGRYGDALNPSGDLEAVAQMWCMLKPGGMLYLGVPTHRRTDSVVFNANRIYSWKRLPHLCSNFQHVGTAGRIHDGKQPVMIFKKMEAPDDSVLL
jgi:hypothetical protein